MNQTNRQKLPLRVDLVSDVVCPWCIIGFKRLEQALNQFKEKIQVNLHWHPFELNPNMPQGGQNLREHLAQKYGTTLSESIAARKRLTAIGASLGFTFNYDDEMRIYNTLKAHQLIHWAKKYGKQTEMQMQLFSSYFSEQKAIDRIKILLEAVTQVDLDINEAKLVLESESQAKSVKSIEAQWINRRIYAVPAFIFNENEEYRIIGAQNTDVFQAQIEELVMNVKLKS